MEFLSPLLFRATPMRTQRFINVPQNFACLDIYDAFNVTVRVVIDDPIHVNSAPGAIALKPYALANPLALFLRGKSRRIFCTKIHMIVDPHAERVSDTDVAATSPRSPARTGQTGPDEEGQVCPPSHSDRSEGRGHGRSLQLLVLAGGPR